MFWALKFFFKFLVFQIFNFSNFRKIILTELVDLGSGSLTYKVICYMFVDLICLVYLFMSVEFLFYAFKYKTLVPRFLSCLVVISVRGAECPLTEFGGLNVFGHPVFIYSVVQSRSNVPASNFQKKNQKLDPNSGFFFVGRIKP